MALFTDTLIEEVAALVSRRQQQLGAALGAAMPSGTADLTPEAPLKQDLVLLIRVANGELLRAHTPEKTLQQIEEALYALLDLLLTTPLQTKAPLPDGFWQTDLGILVSRVRWWLSGDELITISNAAALAFGENNQANRMKIVRAIDNGLLEWVPDPSVANPQQNRRVLRPQVERLRQQRELPK